MASPSPSPTAELDDVNGHKRRSAAAADEDQQKKSKGIRKVVALFEDLATIVQEADKHENYLENPEKDDPELMGKDDGEVVDIRRNHERSYASLKCLVALIPNFLKKIDNSKPQDLQDFYDMLESGAGDARSDDTAKLKEEIANWLNIRTPALVPILDANSRTNRGLQHDVTGRLLCPIEFDWEDLEVHEKVRNCDPAYNSASSPFLHALYAFEKGDPNKVSKGFLMSGLLVRTFKFIFTSPSSSKGIYQELVNLVKVTVILVAESTNRKARRRDVSHGILNQVTPRSIAYAVVQLIFALSDAGSWVNVEKSPHDLNGLYYSIIDFFEDPVNDKADAHAASLL